MQQYAKGAYLRKAEAEQCQVQSTLLLPLFISPRRTGCVGVLEVLQTSEDMAFADVATLLSDSLEVRRGASEAVAAPAEASADAPVLLAGGSAATHRCLEGFQQARGAPDLLCLAVKAQRRRCRGGSALKSREHALCAPAPAAC